MNKKQLQKFIQECVEETIDEVNALAAGGVSATGGAPLGMDMSDSHELMWSGDEENDNKSNKQQNEEFLGKKGKVSYYQMGGSLPKNLYNRKNGKPSKDVGVAGLNAGSSSSEPLERDRKLKDRWYHAESKKARRRASRSLAETYYHGTTVDLKPGEYILPPNETGRVSEKGRKKNLDKVFVTQDAGSAKIYAGRAKHSLGGKPTVYEVKPIGDVDVINAKRGTTVFAVPKAKVVKKVG